MQGEGFCHAVNHCVNYGGAGTGLIFGDGTQLRVKPILKDSDPSIYPLKPKDGTLSACLITDFSPGDISVGNSSSQTQLNASIVQVKNPDTGITEASYGTVLWGSQENFGCFATHNTRPFKMEDSAEEGDACGIMEMDDNFETDEKLNLLSFTLLALRIVFVKGVAANLILTFWLRKS
ncbi:T cell receptor alpha chain MC.7.G5-like isoform 3-T3 [Macrochelys suwanniensis]